MDNFDQLIEAKAFAMQTKEWMVNCVGHISCPGAMVFNHTITLFDECERLNQQIVELENKLKELGYQNES